jgi:hypothetical protein
MLCNKIGFQQGVPASMEGLHTMEKWLKSRTEWSNAVTEDKKIISKNNQGIKEQT